MKNVEDPGFGPRPADFPVEVTILIAGFREERM